MTDEQKKDDNVFDSATAKVAPETIEGAGPSPGIIPDAIEDLRDAHSRIQYSVIDLTIETRKAFLLLLDHLDPHGTSQSLAPLRELFK